MSRYHTIVVDPPWSYRGTPPWRSTSTVSYSLMSTEEIAALPVADLAEPDAHLYCWTVLSRMADAFDVVRSWDFTPRTVLTWCKPGPGLGGGFRGNTEHLIVAYRGLDYSINPTCETCGSRARGSHRCGCETPAWHHKGHPCPPPARTFLDVAEGTWYEAPRGEHSAKPELFLDLIERMSPEPRLEMFARRARFGWDYWGDESLGTAELAA